MMMLFGGLVFVFLGIVMWQLITTNNSRYGTEHEHKEKLKGMPKTTQDILDERYANGEISREEYWAILEDIDSDIDYQ